MNAIIDMQNNLVSTKTYSTGQLSALLSNARSFFSNRNSLNVTDLYGQCINAAATNSPASLIFNDANAQAAYNGAVSLGLPTMSGLFAANASAQVSQVSVQSVSNYQTFTAAQNNHLSGLSYFNSLISGTSSLDIRKGSASLKNANFFCAPTPQDSNMIQAAGVIVGAGAGLVGAAEAAYAILGAELAAQVTVTFLLGGGVALIGIGLAIAGYYAYQYVKGQTTAKDCLGPKFRPALGSSIPGYSSALVNI